MKSPFLVLFLFVRQLQEDKKKFFSNPTSIFSILIIIALQICVKELAMHLYIWKPV